MKYIGVDLHTTQITVCFLENDKHKIKRYSLDELDKFKLQLSLADTIAVESTSNSHWFYYKFKDLVKKIVIVNPSQFKVIAQSVTKTDNNDSKTLAYFLAKDMLPEVKAKTKEEYDVQNLLKNRKLLVEHRKSIKNEIHSMFTKNGIKLNASLLESKKGLLKLLQISDDCILRFCVQTMTDVLLNLNDKINQIEEQIKIFAKQLQGYENLCSIKGIGIITASQILSSIGNISNFNSPKKLSSFIGICPKVRNSNETIRHGRITKRGNPDLRSNLVQCAMVAIRQNNRLKDFYQRIKDRSSHGTAILATARKLLTMIYYTLKYSWTFSDGINRDLLSIHQ